jgi:hypothetical protein
MNQSSYMATNGTNSAIRKWQVRAVFCCCGNPWLQALFFSRAHLLDKNRVV